MDRTPNLDLPYILPSQAQKHVTHNEAIRALDAIAQAGVISRSLTTTPSSPSDGDRYIVAAGATETWLEHDLEIAAWQDGAWMFYEPKAGWLTWIEDEDAIVAWNGSNWAIVSGPDGIFETIAVNGPTADSTNRLVTNSQATLLNHDGSSHQLKINKNAVGDTASVLFQNGFSGRAEFGLTGDDNWHVKVSGDGSTWREAMFVDALTGSVGIGGAPETNLHVIKDGSTSQLAYFDSYGKTANTRWRRANGTYSNPTPILSDDIIGNFGFGGYNGSEFSSSSGAIKIHATEDWSTSATGAKMTFFTTSNGTTSQQQRMLIDHNGYVGIGTTLPSTNLDVGGPVRVGNFAVSTLPSASDSGPGAVIYVSDEVGGAILAFSDGANWRRASDRAIVT